MLIVAEMPFRVFEDYYKHLQAMNIFDGLLCKKSSRRKSRTSSIMIRRLLVQSELNLLRKSSLVLKVALS